MNQPGKGLSMFSLKNILLVLIGISTCSAVLAGTTVDQLLQEFQTQGATQFSAETGKKFWNQAFQSSQASQPRSCTSCHTADVRQYGKHAATGKEIKPMAPSVMSKRLTNPKKIRKWFRRNCNWTLGRECTAQEKGDVLVFLKDQ
jgi:hypothetical protein